MYSYYTCTFSKSAGLCLCLKNIAKAIATINVNSKT